MNILLEIADRDLIIIAVAVLAIIVLGVITFYIANKDVKVKDVFFEDEKKEEKPKPQQLTEEQQKAKAELERVFNQMSADLEAKNPRQAKIDEFEKEQEENAIISYQELMRQATTKDTEPINSLIEKEKPQEKVQLEIDIKEEEEEPKKFKNSEIISPIFGVQNKNAIKNKEVIKKQNVEYKKKEKPIIAKHAYEEIKQNYAEIKQNYEEIKQNYDEDNNKDFLNSLKEFRKNL